MRDVTVEVSTKDRYNILPICLMSIVNQTAKHRIKEILMFDDTEEPIDITKNELYNKIFKIMNSVGINWKFNWGPKMGQVFNHQMALKMAEGDYIWRIDDDNVADGNCLKHMLDYMEKKHYPDIEPKSIGAVAPMIPNPLFPMNWNEICSNKITDWNCSHNLQWLTPNKENAAKIKEANSKKEIHHLYSNFLYKKDAGSRGYFLKYSPVCHTEETLFSFNMHVQGWRLLIHPEAITHHLQCSSGGIRTYKSRFMWEHDGAIFKSIISGQHQVKCIEPKIVVLESGRGDHIAFMAMADELVQVAGDNGVVIGCWFREYIQPLQDKYPDKVRIITVPEIASILPGQMMNYNIYNYMIKTNWKPERGSIVDAYRQLYGVTKPV